MEQEEIIYITRRVRQQIASILPLTEKHVMGAHDISDFKRVVIIVGSSRGGTSSFFDALRHHPRVSSPDGEHGKYYTLNNISYPFYESDRIPPSTEQNDLDLLRLHMLLDVGRTKVDGTDEVHFIDNFITRLPMQFYYRNFDHKGIKEEYLKHPGDYGAVVNRAGIMKRYYDLKSVGIENSEAFNPLSDFYIAETPFIFPHRNKQCLTESDFEDSVLVIKTSVDAYRMQWVRELFPNSDVKFIHLTRNPAASMNGLIDGWLTNRGFFTYMVPGISIDGYPRTDLWNYDLPPNWKALASEDLYTVVWHQWEQAHTHILSYAGEPVLRIKFEDFLYNRQKTIARTLNFIGLNPEDAFFQQHSQSLNMVMTTEEPQPFRWHARRDEIIRTIGELDNGIVGYLNYPGDCTTWY